MGRRVPQLSEPLWACRPHAVSRVRRHELGVLGLSFLNSFHQRVRTAHRRFRPVHHVNNRCSSAAVRCAVPRYAAKSFFFLVSSMGWIIGRHAPFCRCATRFSPFTIAVPEPSNPLRAAQAASAPPQCYMEFSIMEPIYDFLPRLHRRAGLNAKPLRHAGATLAAESRDLDIFWASGSGRGAETPSWYSHTFLGDHSWQPLRRAIWLFHRWWESRRRRKQRTHREVAAKVPVAGLGLLRRLHRALSQSCLTGPITTASVHFSRSTRLYAGSFVFIAEPVLWLLLGMAIIVPWLLALTIPK